jgi:hypothetical protein
MIPRDPKAWLDSPNHVEAQMAALADPPNPMPPLLRRKAAQEYIGVHKTRLYELINARILEVVKDGRMTYVTTASCDRYLIGLARQMRDRTVIRKHGGRK